MCKYKHFTSSFLASKSPTDVLVKVLWIKISTKHYYDRKKKEDSPHMISAIHITSLPEDDKMWK